MKNKKKENEKMKNKRDNLANISRSIFDDKSIAMKRRPDKRRASNRTHCTRQESRENLRQPYIRQTGGKSVVHRRNDRCYWRIWRWGGCVHGSKWGSRWKWGAKPSPRGVDLSYCCCTQCYMP